MNPEQLTHSTSLSHQAGATVAVINGRRNPRECLNADKDRSQEEKPG